MTLSTKEWVAVVVSLAVLGFFFVFGSGLVSFFTGRTNSLSLKEGPEVVVQDMVVGKGEVAVAGDMIVVNYMGRLVTGKVFDSSLERGEPFQFILGVGQVIEGWDRGIPGMRVGGKRIISIPSYLGYGANDYGPIPGGSTLIFEVDLLKVQK